ncbi:MAG: hypothetical protein ACHP65_06950, partial [Legionellales bacterium]
IPCWYFQIPYFYQVITLVFSLFITAVLACLFFVFKSALTFNCHFICSLCAAFMVFIQNLLAGLYQQCEQIKSAFFC